MTCGAVVVLVGGLVGTLLAPVPALATLPVATMIVGVATGTIPASMIMQRVGRKAGFIGAAVTASTAAMMASWSIQQGSFFLFCLSIGFIGVALAFAQQYRFAAVESVPAEDASRAISFMLLGGVVAAILGPWMANAGKDWTGISYQGSFLALSLMAIIPAFLLLFYTEQKFPAAVEVVPQRTLKQIARNPGFIVAVLSGAVGYAVMSLIMTATPISMHHIDQHSFDDTTWVIQWHVVAMYLPSLVTGRLIMAWGVRCIMLLGVAAMFGCILFALNGHSIFNYWVALVLLGLGWNFLFVSGTTKLVLHYQPNERFKAQAVNDFCIFTCQATASLSAGWVLHWLSWELIAVFSLPLLAVLILAIGYDRMMNKAG